MEEKQAILVVDDDREIVRVLGKLHPENKK